MIGSLAALANGVVYPIFSIFLGKMLQALLNVDINNNNQDAIDNINSYALIFLLLGVASFILMIFQTWFFNLVGE